MVKYEKALVALEKRFSSSQVSGEMIRNWVVKHITPRHCIRRATADVTARR